MNGKVFMLAWTTSRLGPGRFHPAASRWPRQGYGPLRGRRYWAFPVHTISLPVTQYEKAMPSALVTRISSPARSIPMKLKCVSRWRGIDCCPAHAWLRRLAEMGGSRRQETVRFHPRARLR